MPNRAANFHEVLTRGEAVQGASDRSFGLAFFSLFTLIGLIKLWSEAASGFYWLGAAGVMLIFALLAPSALRPFNRLWLNLGMLLYRVTNPVVMALLFFLVVTPMGVLMRITGRRPLQLTREPATRSYWIERRPPGPAPAGMDRQF